MSGGGKRSRQKGRRSPSRSTRQDRWRVAVHESGHVLAAFLLGVRVLDVTIVPGTTEDGSGYAGRTELAHDPEDLRRALDEYYDVENDGDEREEKTFFLLLKSMQVSCAGMISEELFFGSAERSGLEPDLVALSRCAERLCPPDAKECSELSAPMSLDMTMEEAMAAATQLMAGAPKHEYEYLLDWVEHRTRKLLRARREVLEALANELLERETLLASEVVATVLTAMKQRWRPEGTVSPRASPAARRRRPA